MDRIGRAYALSKIREIWSFSIWTLFKNLGAYVNKPDR